MIEAAMPTIAYKDSLRAIAQDNPDFTRELLEDAVNAMLRGDLDEGRIFLKDYVNATIGFAELGRRMGKDDKNLMRSLCPRGNPAASTLIAIVQTLSKAEDFTIAAHIIPRQPSPAL